MQGRKWKRFTVVLYLFAVHVLALLFIFDRFVAPYVWKDDAFTKKVESPTEMTPVPTVMPVPSIEPENVNAAENPAVSATNSNQNLETNTNQAADQSQPPAPSDVLMIPVVGIKPAQLLNTYADSRSDNRVHDAIDIPAPAGTPVVATANGEIIKFFDSERGGITIYQLSADKKYIYYYAHLQSRADGLKEKDFVTQGRVIGYVGDTGNAGAGNNHLHFSITLAKDPQRFWEGEYINPFPLLRNGREAR
jgi:murein DD-endopeptidase MepM/ murein hydrolase activator NlpD